MVRSRNMTEIPKPPQKFKRSVAIRKKNDRRYKFSGKQIVTEKRNRFKKQDKAYVSVEDLDKQMTDYFMKRDPVAAAKSLDTDLDSYWERKGDQNKVSSSVADLKSKGAEGDLEGGNVERNF